jgi:molybdenum cofactor synthesis domain-containing protein
MALPLVSSWARVLPRRVGMCGMRAASHVSRASAALSTSTDPPSAALMIIGNEVLSGSIADANTPWLARLLHSRGVDLVRVEVVPDDAADIGATCLRLQERVGPGGFVFTSGGIGPTHDDITYDAIAAALGLAVQVHAPTVALMQEHYAARGVELNESRLRMAALPTPAEVLVTPGLWVPLVVAGGNVHILPGIPRLFQGMIEVHVGRFKGPASHSVELYADVGEGDVAAPLAAVAAAHPAVRIGSYPNTKFDMNDPDQKLAYRVKFVCEGRDTAAVEAAAAAVVEAVPGTTKDLPQ